MSIELTITTTERCQFVGITRRIEELVGASGVKIGFCSVHCPHTTAGLTINENADPDVVADMLHVLEGMAPSRDPYYKHAEGNSAAHVKASLMGFHLRVPVANGRLELGRWQGMYLCEFDGPRRRSLLVLVEPITS